MGIRGLPKALKESGAIAASSCKDSNKQTHVDFLAYFFRLLQSRAFKVLQNKPKAGYSSSTVTPDSEPQLETDPNVGSRKRKNMTEHSSPSFDRCIPFGPEQTMTELMEDAITRLDHKSLFLDSEGLSPTEAKKDQVSVDSMYPSFVIS